MKFIRRQSPRDELTYLKTEAARKASRRFCPGFHAAAEAEVFWKGRIQDAVSGAAFHQNRRRGASRGLHKPCVIWRTVTDGPPFVHSPEGKPCADSL